MTDQQISLEMNKRAPKTQIHNDVSQSLSSIVDVNEKNNMNSIEEFDDDKDDRPLASDRKGVDDGFFHTDDIESSTNTKNPSRPRRPSFVYAGYDGAGFVEINGVQTPIPDVNAYQQKKTLAQGMMDLALLSANASQLRYVLETSSEHPYFYPSIIFISLSIIFQVAVGVGLILNGRYNIRNKKEICRANKINNYTVIGIFIITVVNVLLSAFGVANASGTA